MKKLVLVLLGLGALIEAIPQQRLMSGIICFSEITKMNINIEGDGSEFSSALPDEIKSEKELLFTAEASLYKKESGETDISEMAKEDNQAVKIMISQPDNILYTDFNTGSTVEQREFLTRMFLVEGVLPQRSWKITGMSREILGYTCQEARSEKDSVVIVAWYTPEIPVSGGPAKFGGLPGMILQVDVDNGDRQFIAQKIEFKEFSAADLQKPKKGKPVSDEEFKEIVAEKMKEQGGGSGDGHTMTIVIKN